MSEKRKAGRPKGDQLPLTAAERMANTRRRKKIYTEECKSVGVTSMQYSVDAKLLAAFEEMQRVFKTIRVEEMLFVAMKDYLQNADLDGAFCAAAGIEDLAQHKMRFEQARVKAFVRFKEEGLLDPRMHQAKDFESLSGESDAR